MVCSLTNTPGNLPAAHFRLEPPHIPGDMVAIKNHHKKDFDMNVNVQKFSILSE